MSNLFSLPKRQQPQGPLPPAKPAAGEPARAAKDMRRRAAGATGQRSTLQTQFNRGKSLLGE